MASDDYDHGGPDDDDAPPVLGLVAAAAAAVVHRARRDDHAAQAVRALRGLHASWRSEELERRGYQAVLPSKGDADYAAFRRGLRRVQGLIVGEERGVVLVDLGAGEPQPGRCGRAYATTRGLRYYRCIAQPA